MNYNNYFIKLEKNIESILNIYVKEIKIKTNRSFFNSYLKYLYVSSYNKKPFKYLKKIKNRLKIVGSAHNKIEINEKIKQGCDEIIVSRLFKSSKAGFLNISKFNLLVSGKNNIIALGGINEKNYKKLKLANIKGYAVLSDLKNYPKYLML